jgi:outer membrane protein assembly factor BamB
VVWLACLAAIPAATARSAAARSVQLTTYGYGLPRLGASPGPVGVSTAQAPRLRLAWGANLDGAINTQALIVNGVHVRLRIHHRRVSRVRDLAIVGTEHGEVAAMRVTSGTLIWSRHIGRRRISPACQASPDGYFGVTGTLVADRVHNRVYAVDVDGRAWAFDLGTGRTVPGWPVRVHPDGGGDFVWSALSLSRGWLYVPIASLCDRGRYYGGIKAIDVTHPRFIHRWLTTSGTRAWAGGIWGWAGVSIDPRTGTVFGATGNSIGTSNEASGYAERVVRLSSLLQLEQSNYPLRPPFHTGDRDFGTTPVLIRAPGCPLQAIAINKNGVLYRYNADDVDDGPRQRIAVARGEARFIPLYGVPAYDPSSRRLVLTSPSSIGAQRAGIQTFIFTRHCTLLPSWQHGFDRPDAGSAPTIAQGVLYISSGRNATLRIYRLRDGQPLGAHHLGSTAFATPAVADARLIEGDWRGHVWAFRPK